MKKLRFFELFSLNMYWVGLSFMWNALHPIVLPAVLLHLVPETKKNTYLGILTFTGLILAMIIQPVSGAWSDQWRSKWGRRRPLILRGTILDFIFIGLLAWSGSFAWVVLAYIGLQVSSNLAHGPLQGLLPDRVPKSQMGVASSWKNILDMAGLIVASLLAGRLLDPNQRHPVMIMVVTGIVLFIGASITLLGTRETPSNEELSGSEITPRFRLTRSDFVDHLPFWRMILVRFVFLFGIYGIQAFIQYYLRDALHVENPIKLTGDLLAILTVTLIIFVYFGGYFSDRFGSKSVMVIAGVLGTIGSILLSFAATPKMLMIYGSILGAGIGLFLTSNWSLANQLAPEGQEGKFMGLTNLATAGAGAAGRLEGPLVDLFNQAKPGAFMGYTGLFYFAAICCIVSALLVPVIHLEKKHDP